MASRGAQDPLAPRPGALVGSLDPRRVRSGVARGPEGLFQRRVRPRVFGEPAFDAELTDAAVCAARPHVVAHDAWRRMLAAARADGVPDTEPPGGGALAIHSAYRSVAFQAEVWAFRLAERRRAREAAGLPPLSERELARRQRRWTAAPGTSAHHTGLALDLGLYHLGKRAARRHPAYRWLARNARRFGFYPYLPEAWHWEYNPPGLVEQLAALRRCLAAEGACGDLLRAPAEIPQASPAPRRRGTTPPSRAPGGPSVDRGPAAWHRLPPTTPAGGRRGRRSPVDQEEGDVKVKLKQVQGLHFRAQTPSGHTLDVDGAAAHGGTDQGPRPMELVLVSLASCSGIDVALILDKGRQPYEGLEIDVEGVRADAVPAVYEKIHVHYTATGALAPDRLERAVRLSMEKYCSVTKMLQPSVEVTWSCAVARPAEGEPEVIES